MTKQPSQYDGRERTRTILTILIALAMVTFPIAGAITPVVTDQPTWVLTDRISPNPDHLDDGNDFGGTIALTDTTLFVTERGHDAVHVYQKTPTSQWEHAQTITPHEPHPNPRFGYDIAAHQDTLLIGAPGMETAYVYQQTDNGWELAHELTSDQPGDFFANSLAVHDDTIAIAAIETDHDAGAIHAYTLDPDPEHEAILTLPDAQPNDRLGFDIDLHEDTIAAVTSNDAAHTFQRTEGAWALTATDIANTQAARAISLHGDTLAVGHPSDHTLSAIHNGIVTVHKRSPDGWTHTATLQAQDLNPLETSNRFGASLDLNDDRLAIGAPHDDAAPGIEILPSEQDRTLCLRAPTLETCDPEGAAYIYENATGAWTQTTKLTAPDQGAGNPIGNPLTGHTRANYGASIALSPTPGNLAIAAPTADTALAHTGAIYHYTHPLEAATQ